MLVKRCFFSAINGHSGLGLYNMQVGDLVCVILGCDHPIVLWSVHGRESTPQWQVVGSAIVPRIMSGAAIYGGKLPACTSELIQSYTDDSIGVHSEI
jgi:hypothetical protein